MPKKCSNQVCNSYTFNKKNRYCDTCVKYGYIGKQPLSKVKNEDDKITESLKRLFRVNKCRKNWSKQDAIEYLKENGLEIYINQIDELRPKKKYRKKKK